MPYETPIREDIYCHCGIIAEIRTSWKDSNPSRRFYGCSKFGAKDACEQPWKLHYPSPKLKKLYVRDSPIECLKSVKVLGLGTNEMNIISAPGLVSFSYEGYSIPCFNCSVSKCKYNICIIAHKDHLVASWFVQLEEWLSHLNGSTILLNIYLTSLDYIDNLSSCSSYGAGDLVENLCIDFLEFMEEKIRSSSFPAFVDIYSGVADLRPSISSGPIPLTQALDAINVAVIGVVEIRRAIYERLGLQNL